MENCSNEKNRDRSLKYISIESFEYPEEIHLKHIEDDNRDNENFQIQVRPNNFLDSKCNNKSLKDKFQSTKQNNNSKSKNQSPLVVQIDQAYVLTQSNNFINSNWLDSPKIKIECAENWVLNWNKLRFRPLEKLQEK